MDNKDSAVIETVESRVLALRGMQVIVDRDVADIYGVTTRDINKAVKNNPKIFPRATLLN